MKCIGTLDDMIRTIKDQRFTKLLVVACKPTEDENTLDYFAFQMNMSEDEIGSLLQEMGYEYIYGGSEITM